MYFCLFKKHIEMRDIGFFFIFRSKFCSLIIIETFFIIAGIALEYRLTSQIKSAEIAKNTILQLYWQ